MLLAVKGKGPERTRSVRCCPLQPFQQNEHAAARCAAIDRLNIAFVFPLVPSYPADLQHLPLPPARRRREQRPPLVLIACKS